MSKQTARTDYAREFKKVIEGFRYNRSIREIFTDWLEIAACAVHQAPYHDDVVPKDKNFDQVEAQYLATVKKYTREELDAFAKLLGITKMALWEEKADFLGQIYMDLEISQDRSGEFFTPFPISLMMTKMLLADAPEHIREKGFITVAEPACGGGGMLIAAAKVLEDAGYKPGEVLFFEATDISKPCCDMAYIQTSLLGLSGIVRHGNSLTTKEWSHRFTPICRVFPTRTNTFIDSLLPVKADENSMATADAATPPLHENEQDQVQQAPMLNLQAEALAQEHEGEPEQQTKQNRSPKTPIATPVIDKLSEEAEALVQGRLF